MKSTHIRILTIGAAVLLVAVPAAIAEGRHGYGGPGGFRHMLKQLDLTSQTGSRKNPGKT